MGEGLMRKTLANILRRVANRIDPKDNRAVIAGEQVIPLEWTPTDDLAAEILRRHDAAVIWYGREMRASGGTVDVAGTVAYRIRPINLVPVMKHITVTLYKALSEGEKPL
jgi:hypothetical protein